MAKREKNKFKKSVKALKHLIHSRISFKDFEGSLFFQLNEEVKWEDINTRTFFHEFEILESMVDESRELKRSGDLSLNSHATMPFVYGFGIKFGFLFMVFVMKFEFLVVYEVLDLCMNFMSF